MALIKQNELFKKFIQNFGNKFEEYAISTVRRENQALLASLRGLELKQKVSVVHEVKIQKAVRGQNQTKVPALTSNEQPFSFNNTKRSLSVGIIPKQNVQEQKIMNSASRQSLGTEERSKRVNELTRKKKINVSLLTPQKSKDIFYQQNVSIDPKTDIFLRLASGKKQAPQIVTRKSIIKDESIKRENRGRSIQILKELSIQTSKDNEPVRVPLNKLIYALEVRRPILDDI